MYEPITQPILLLQGCTPKALVIQPHLSSWGAVFIPGCLLTIKTDLGVNSVMGIMGRRKQL